MWWDLEGLHWGRMSFRKLADLKVLARRCKSVSKLTVESKSLSYEIHNWPIVFQSALQSSDRCISCNHEWTFFNDKTSTFRLYFCAPLFAVHKRLVYLKTHEWSETRAGFFQAQTINSPGSQAELFNSVSSIPIAWTTTYLFPNQPRNPDVDRIPKGQARGDDGKENLPEMTRGRLKDVGSSN